MEYLLPRHPLLTSKEPNEDPAMEMQDLITLLQSEQYAFCAYPDAISLLNGYILA
jgi:hypothetical protein